VTLRTIDHSNAVTAIKAGIFNCLKNFVGLEQIKKELKKPAASVMNQIRNSEKHAQTPSL
jgi:hypothetical protein